MREGNHSIVDNAKRIRKLSALEFAKKRTDPV